MLEVCPMTLREANAYVEQYHRHHGPVVGHKFSIGLSDGEKIVGVAIVGRPVARHLDDGWTLEVNRLCTDGTRNACSMLYAAAWRAARAMGYKRLVTYILDTENGASLRAAGWKCIGQAGGLRWTGKRRPEVDLCPAQMKIRFERTEVLNETGRLADDSPLDDSHGRWHCVYRVLFQKHFDRRDPHVAETVLVGE